MGWLNRMTQFKEKAGKGAAFPIPVTVVPQNLSDEDIDSLA